MEMCGLFRVVTSKVLCQYVTLAFDFRSGEGRGTFQLRQVMLSKYERTSCRKNRPKISFVLLVFSLSAVGIPFARY